MTKQPNETYWVIRDQNGTLTMHQMKGKPQTDTCQILNSFPPVPSHIALSTLSAVINKRKIAKELVNIGAQLTAQLNVSKAQSKSPQQGQPHETKSESPLT
ncbi:hypothetical protein [Oceanospirillum maris]|uniref:hypothetical protein n=1 Tax=Oceanospirillum maris TaxID=64977 RepID=UPI0012FEA0FC|nr:hypothetical protein [Oceanospirillum maris]